MLGSRNWTRRIMVHRQTKRNQLGLGLHLPWCRCRHIITVGGHPLAERQEGCDQNRRVLPILRYGRVTDSTRR